MRISYLVLFVIVIFSQCGCGSDERMARGRNDLPVHCLDKPKPGPCKKKRIAGYFYDYRRDKCRVIDYGSCKGKAPFATLEACKEACEVGDRPVPEQKQTAPPSEPMLQTD